MWRQTAVFRASRAARDGIVISKAAVHHAAFDAMAHPKGRLRSHAPMIFHLKPAWRKLFPIPTIMLLLICGLTPANRTFKYQFVEDQYPTDISPELACGLCEPLLAKNVKPTG